MVRYCDLFFSFFKIGTFTIGGGYAMIPLMEKELVDRHQWVSHEDFLDQISLSQAMPGVFAVNMATTVGYRLRGISGAIVATVGNVVAPIAIILLIAIFFQRFRDNEVVNRIFLGLRPAVVALIAAPVFKMARTAQVSWRNAWIPIVATLLIWLLHVNPVWVVLGAALLGLFYGKWKGSRQ